jgi:ADP-heptose:LPS heptosyltransferase
MPYAVVNLSAYSKNRRWAAHHAFVVCRELLWHIPGIALVVTAAPQQRRQVETLVQAVGDSRCRAFQGSLSELIALVAGAAWVLSPDTAVVHLASALGKPVVALYSELIKVAEWYPLGVPSVCVLSPLWGGVVFVPPGAVVEAVERLLQEVIPAGAVIPPVPLPSGGALSGSATGKC